MNVFDERILPPPESACLRVPLPASHDVLLEEGLAPRDAVKPEAGDVDGLVRAGGQQLGHGPPGPRRLLEPVAGEAVAEHEVVDVRVAPVRSGGRREGETRLPARGWWACEWRPMTAFWSRVLYS